MSFKRANCGGIIIDDETIVEENGVLKAVSSGGTDVVANPTLAGTEADLTGLQVGDTKYKVGGSSGGGVLVAHMTVEGTTGTLDKTWREIHDADFAVIPVPRGLTEKSTGFVYGTGFSDDNGYGVSAFLVSGENIRPMDFFASAEDGYPSVTIGN